ERPINGLTLPHVVGSVELDHLDEASDLDQDRRHVDSFYLDCHHDYRDGANETQTDADRMHDTIGDDLSAVVMPADLSRTSVGHSNEIAWKIHDLKQLYNLVYALYHYFGRFFAGTGFPNHFFCDSWVVGFLEGPTMVSRTADWRDELGRWLKPFLDRLGHKARRQMCPLYVSGLIGPGDRKSVQPMAKRLALGACDQLHHFIAAGVWDATPVE